MGLLLILLRDLILPHLLRGLHFALNRVLVPKNHFVNASSRTTSVTLTVGICQLPSRETSGRSAGAVALLARSEARVMRGILKEYLNTFSWLKSPRMRVTEPRCTG